MCHLCKALNPQQNPCCSAVVGKCIGIVGAETHTVGHTSLDEIALWFASCSTVAQIYVLLKDHSTCHYYGCQCEPCAQSSVVLTVRKRFTSARSGV